MYNVYNTSDSHDNGEQSGEGERGQTERRKRERELCTVQYMVGYSIKWFSVSCMVVYIDISTKQHLIRNIVWCDLGKLSCKPSWKWSGGRRVLAKGYTDYK